MAYSGFYDSFNPNQMIFFHIKIVLELIANK